MSVCSCGFIYLFRSTTSQQAEDRPPFWVNSGETRGRGGAKRRTEVREEGGNKGCEDLEEQNKFVADRQTAHVTPHPHLEPVPGNLTPALTSQREEKHMREGPHRKYFPLLLRVKHRSVRLVT